MDAKKLNAPVNTRSAKRPVLASANEHPGVQTLQDVHILLVDDEQRILRILMRMLESDGARVTCAQSGSEVKKILMQNSMDLLLCDIFMPEGDGLETITWARRHSPDMKIAVMSGGGSLFKGYDFLDVAMKLGAKLAIQKPFDTRTVLSRLRQLVGRTDCE